MNIGIPLNYLSLSRYLGGGFSPEIKIAANKVSNNPKVDITKTLLLNGVLNLKYSFANDYIIKSKSMIEPFLKGGIGQTYLDQTGNKFFTTFQMGGGLAFWFGKQRNFGIQLQQLYHVVPSVKANYLDYFEYSGTLAYKFGMKDRDRDGVPDSKDSCPDEKGIKVLYGCPDKDGDGIADHKDRCPDNAGPKHFQGCPDKDGDSVPDIDDKCVDIPGLIYLQGCPDKDGDSIPDYQDSCPTVKGLRMFHGCPDRDKDMVEDKYDKCPDIPGLPQFLGCPDKDGDGIIDEEDKCPDEYGLKKNFGCPEKENSDNLNSKLAFHAKSIFFATNKHAILPKSYPVLSEIAFIMKENPKTVFVVEGHADITGKEKLNIALSRNRAQAVTEYLISQGVPRASIEPAGFGFKYPIADNKSTSGRAKNRRVDITVKR
jgi:OOP family OmpA-OmpF porin